MPDLPGGEGIVMADQPEDPRPRRGAGSDEDGQPLDHTPFDPIRDDDEDEAAETQRLPVNRDESLDHTAPFDPIRDDERPAPSDPIRDEGDERSVPSDPAGSVGDERSVPSDPAGSGDAAAQTQPLPDDPDRTARIESVADDRTTQISAADRTARLPRSGPHNGSPQDDPTTPIRQQGPRNATPPVDRAWAGRAGIPEPGGPGGPPDDGPPSGGGWQPSDGGGRRWWMPILVGIIALILLGVLAFGLWLILRGDGSTPAPTPTTSAPAPTTAAPTTVAPTTSSPSPTVTTPAAIEVPEVEGRSVLEAGQVLSDAGLPARLTYVASDEPAGTVVGSDPPAGAQVKPGTTVTLQVSLGPTTAPTTPAVTATPTTPPVIPPGP
ncbi:PASTA domain-containing protein [Asanoa sp. NPDC049573]|uniref:PASTA domain-containing protein n=1 Tax=Asanoa sp. NPDC049573 TaxID=3155396 RepID=UPI0034192920